MSRTSSSCRWVARAVAAGAMVFLMAACTMPSPTQSSNSTPPSHATSGSSAPSSHRTVRLSCDDGTSGAVPTGNVNVAVGGITLEGVVGNIQGVRTDDIKMRVPAGDTLYIVKAPAWLKAGAAATVELSPASDGYLAWVPAQLWTSGSAAGVDLTPWMASKLVFDGCPDRDVTYLGGLLSTTRDSCLTLQVADAAGKSQQVSVGSACE